MSWSDKKYASDDHSDNHHDKRHDNVKAHKDKGYGRGFCGPCAPINVCCPRVKFPKIACPEFEPVPICCPEINFDYPEIKVPVCKFPKIPVPVCGPVCGPYKGHKAHKADKPKHGKQPVLEKSHCKNKKY